MVQVTHRIRYPPFESGKLNAEQIPVVEYSFEIDGPVIPPFKLGKTNSWHVERIIEGNYETDSKYHGAVPQIIEKQRTGWYLLPHPIHAKARKFINFVVLVLLACLFYLFSTPLQTSLVIPTFGTGKVRLGLLDYPLLAVIIVPLMLIPIALRVAANLGDLRRQNFFLLNSPPRPQINFEETITGSNLKGKIKFLLIVMIFVLPFVVSNHLYKKHLSGEKLNTTNYGSFINPIVSLQDTSFFDITTNSRKYNSLDRKWYLIYITNPNCSDSCQNDIYLLRQINIALGKDMERVKRIVLLNDDTKTNLGKELQIKYPNLIVVSNQSSSFTKVLNKVKRNLNLFLVDPNGNVILGYNENFEGKKLLKDIKKLLKLSKIG